MKLIALSLLLCRAVAASGSPADCRSEIVAQSPIPALAGKIDDPAPMPLTPFACAAGSQAAIAAWLAAHPRYAGWRIAGVRCGAIEQPT